MRGPVVARRAPSMHRRRASSIRRAARPRFHINNTDRHMTTSTRHDIAAIQEKIREESAFVERLLDEVGRVIVGQRYMVERLC